MAEPLSLEEILSKIEVGTRQLKIQYDMFFSGVIPRQPYETRKELEILIKTLGSTPMQRFADRYRFNSLATRYQSLAELWSKMLRAKEEGRLRPGIPGFVDSAGRSSAARAAASPPGAPPPAPPAVPPAAGRGRGAGGSVFFTTSFRNPAVDETAVRAFYEKYLEAGKKGGVEAADRLSYNHFASQIAAKTQAIKKKSGCDAVTYSIVIKDKGISLKAAPKKVEGEET